MTRIKNYATVAAALLLLAVMSDGRTEEPTRLFGADDILRLRTVSEPQLSPDGEWVVYTVSVNDLEKDEETSDLWMVSWQGGAEVQLTHSPESESSPRWSPDGRWLAFLAARGGDDAVTQVWVMDRRGGEARAVTTLPGGVSSFEWSPDSTRLLLVAQHGGEANADQDKPKPIVIDRFQFKEDETGYLTGARSHLFVADLAGGAAVQLTQGAYDHRMPAWSPDGKSLVYVSKRGADPDWHVNWDLFVADALPGAPARQLTTHPGPDCDPEWGYGSPPMFSPDGSRIVYQQAGDPALSWFGVVQIAVVPVAGGEPMLPAATLDRNAQSPRWSDDGRHIYFILQDDLGQQLVRMPAGGGRIERLTDAHAVVNAFDIGPRGRIAMLQTDARHPDEIFALDGGKPRRLTHQNDAWLGEIRLAEVSDIAAPSSNDQATVHGMLVTPPDYQPGRRYPTIVRLHGGPVSQYQYEFLEEVQLYAAHGYVVVAPNYRGSSGRGEDWQKAILGDWGVLEVQDVLGTVDALVERGIADPNRLGVGGWSYGGILTNYVIASDTRFRAAVSGAGSSNMLAGYGTDMYVRDWETELGLPWRDTERWLKVSYPFFRADRIRTPTLFMGGALDYNVPIIHSEQMYQALKRLDVPTQLVVYPGAYHSLDRPSFWKDRLLRFLGWFDRYLKDGVNPE
jgi:dipeptidyl aminopeptidase/acylaminoacyl peptidase